MGRYEIRERLGSGGMAVVYKAVDNVLNRTVTIKVLQDQFASNEDFVLRFRKEAQAIAALSHVNIVHVFDVGSSEGVHYLIMEYIEGRTLKEVIQRKGKLSPDEALDYVSQILSGLAHAHSYGVVHRDIKPQNIMITKENRVKIMDFGLALNMTDSTITYDNNIIGSVYYIAPEMAQKGSGDARADIYATGVVLYEMLTGKLPFSGDSPIAIALQHVEGKYAPVDEIDPDIPFEIARLVDKAMAKDPNNRYQSAGKMLHDIVRVAEEYDIPLLSYIGEGGEAVAAANGSAGEEREYDDDFGLHKNKTRREEKKGESHRHEAPKHSSGKNKDKKLKRIAIIVAAAILLLAIGGYGLMRVFTGTDEVEVPLLEGKTVDEATSLLDQLELTYNIINVTDNEVPENEVITQSVSAGQKVKAGREITLTVSSGAEQVTVPNLVGKKQSAAESALDELGLTYSAETEYSSTVDKGKVIRHSPGANAKAAVGSKVVLTVSAGPEIKEVTVPNVIGLTLADAKTLLQNRGLKVGEVSEKSSDEATAGYVIYQSISSNTTVDEGTTVNITVSTGSSNKPSEPDGEGVDIEYTVPDGATNATVTIVVNDASGSRSVYSGTHNAGDNITRTVTVQAPGVVIVQLNGTDVYRKAVN